MNTNKLKAYAPKARLAFMDAVKKRAAVLGIYENKISEATTQGTDTLIEGRIFTRKQGQQRQQLVKRIEALGGGKDGYNQFINEMAFTWFNRFTAIRFMEVNGYLDHGFRMLSKEVDAEFGQGFEILAHAADVAEDLGLNKADIVEMLLAGDKEEELYRELLLAQCHQLSKIMPFMFEKLDDATELLLPDNLTKTDSILKALVNDVPEDNWREIEVIGWLYQFYISEHKDAVIGKVVKKEDIPAATQLFTPNWIVKYLVQNSLGRQWLATYPDSDLKEKMEYYITPAEQSDEVIEQLKAITPTNIDPEQIKVLDPACGSGHILVEVYEVLREIYLERGYRLREIPELILTQNIYGLDIDDRAAQMAAFAVLMKAREDDRRILSRDITLNIYPVQSTEKLNINQLWSDLDLDGNKQAGSMGDLFAEPQLELAEPTAKNKIYFDLLYYLKEQFIDAKNLGSLVEVNSSKLNYLIQLREKLQDIAQGREPTSRKAAENFLPIVEQSIVLATKYSVVVANPPYMGSKGMNSELKNFAKKSYPQSKSDLFAMFIERGFNWLIPNGFNAMVTMQSWMFLPSYEKLRTSLLNKKTLFSQLHMGNGVMKIAFGTAATVFKNDIISNYVGSYCYCTTKDLANNGIPFDFPIKNERLVNVNQSSYAQVPGKPFIYWASKEVFNSFVTGKALEEVASPRTGLNTTDNDTFVRLWHEVEFNNINFTTNDIAKTAEQNETWYPFQKGGDYRKWYGNNDYVVNWKNNGSQIKAAVMNNPRDNTTKHWSRRIFNTEFYFKEGVCWSTISSADFSARYMTEGFIFSNAAGGIFPKSMTIKEIVALVNSPIPNYMFSMLNPTVNYSSGLVGQAPVVPFNIDDELINKALSISKKDWDSFEVSWHFKASPLLCYTEESKIKCAHDHFLSHSLAFSKELLEVETLNNEIIINAYKLTEELEAPSNLEDITLKTNPYNKYKNHISDIDRMKAFTSDNIVDLISYTIGCLMGRYSLDHEGLIYANAGNKGFKELVTEGAYKTFPADDDGIVPLAAEDWLFEDDATSRFRDFVKTVWGEDHLQENLDFVAESLCLDAIKPKKNESAMETIRRYFSTQFYKDHLKTYKKRPIYWLFSSGKEKAFECLVYLHRYNESTLARMRTEYVTPLMGKLETQNSVLTESRTNASSTEQRRIDKELKSIEKKQSELRAFDEELKHLAEMKISIDLDDGVKVNYGKFGNLLADVKAIHGKKPEEIK
ncbi:BREX-1 system adenine-specific DNA-methyltransferase PglX [Vibrio parahaemolyticus]|uniref:BREX-1 system adenine-specific DNA-methyltransferase PglX n=1 Tax=Vibrio parahaemolyticus TaxID=670 RepID=UPI00084B9786|nr:BREX-1 system adenine-specific DNA-methyltransferase PglX [Vibrio parahaemolyticus]EIU6807739.1 BREX-1 system adenine-specific DNA-methyltransferase PglX [Vibrio parahaemolyticus]OEB49523.1 type II restriction endonuclease [Vibrio parahaemolyticus]WMN85476.1 BREX-1 system adenine-specific DNA-methyltransferase PglX [Vibrio parahaemolyticus]